MKPLATMAGVLATALLAACSGMPVSVGTHANAPLPSGTERPISSEACGFQLLLFIPININDRAQRAYRELEVAAAGDVITDVEVSERWTWALLGTVYCTGFQAKAIRAS